MFSSTTKKFILFVCVSCLVVWCIGETAESEGAVMDKAEKAALYSAIQGFVGDRWSGSDLYPDPCGWTPIQGVSCDIYDGLWYVTALSFGPVLENSLVCADEVAFKAQLFELKRLKSLSFFNCFMSSSQNPTTIPNDQWLNLSSSLESLEFRSNPGLIGQVPSTIASLTKLQSLVLLENGLTGELPKDIGNLTKLKRLVLAGNKFTGKIPDLGGLSELLILDMSRNSLSGALPLTVGGLTSLLKLDLSSNYLEGKLPRDISFLQNLTLLDLRNNRFSGGLTKEIQEMSSLTELVLSNNQLGGDIMEIEWQKLGNLVILDLSNMGMRGNIPDSMVQLKKLRFLGLSNNNLTGNLLPEIETMPCLSALHINGNNISGELQFSEMFYLRMGRKFAAWGNPNLCYPFEQISSSHVPFGVSTCKKRKEVTLFQPNSKTLVWNQGFNSIPSLGLSSSCSIGFCWIFLVEALMMAVLLNWLL